MKRVIVYAIGFAALLVSISACDDGFLTRVPQDAMSDETFFNNPSDFKTYVNGLYNGFLPNGGTMPGAENGTDNLVQNNPGGQEMQHSNSGQANQTNGTWNGTYSQIREVNYVLENKDKLGTRNEEANQYIGEAYFIRAWHYFTLLKAFGGVPYIDKVLNTESQELFKPRDSRNFIASQIIADLDSAIVLMDWKGQGFATPPRLNKESALTMKTRVGLYEGSWEYYHGRKGTPFEVEGEDGTDFLTEAVSAGDMLIDNQGANVYEGRAGFEYYDLHNKADYQNILGVFLYAHYDASQDIAQNHIVSTHSWAASLTKSAVDNYLMEDGKPESVSSVSYDYTDQGSLISARDPRLNQTIYSPERGPIVDYMLSNVAGTFPTEGISKGPYMKLSEEGQVGGYTIFKGLTPEVASRFQDNRDDYILRYGEALLNYAEAKAILGTITQSDIDKTVNVLRDRVGMAHLNMAEANGWNVTYPISEGYDPTAPNILNEIRRERRVELILEGFRRTDLKRWAIYEDVVNGYKPVAAYYQELADWWNNDSLVVAAGYDESEVDALKLIPGSNIDVTGEFINPLWKNSDFTPAGRGYFIDPDRDYLQAIPQQEINFYEEEGDVTLEQNPGWF